MVSLGCTAALQDSYTRPCFALVLFSFKLGGRASCNAGKSGGRCEQCRPCCRERREARSMATHAVAGRAAAFWVMLADGRDASGPDEGQHRRLPNAQREGARQHNSCCGSGRCSHPRTAAVIAERPAAARRRGAPPPPLPLPRLPLLPLSLRASCPSPQAAAGPNPLCRNLHCVQQQQQQEQQQQQQQQAANSSVLAQQMLRQHCWPVNGSDCLKTSEL